MKKQIDGLGFFAKWVAPILFSAFKGIAAQVEKEDLKQPILGLIGQLEKVVQLLTDSDKENAAQLQAWAELNGYDAAKDALHLVLQILETAKVNVPMFVKDWVKGL
jgi:hypothetical protein